MNAAAAPLLSDANRVRISNAFRGGRLVQIKFTDFARLAAQGGFLTMFGPTPDQAVRDLVHRLGVSPDAVQARAMQLGDVAILVRMPADASPEYHPNTIQPVAFVEGLAQHEIAEALDWLSRSAQAA